MSINTTYDVFIGVLYNICCNMPIEKNKTGEVGCYGILQTIAGFERRP